MFRRLLPQAVDAVRSERYCILNGFQSVAARAVLAFYAGSIPTAMRPHLPNHDRLSLIEADIRGIPSILAQLASLAEIRDPNTGVYRTPAVPERSRAEDVHRALWRLHEKVFRQWLSLNLEGQKADLDLCLSGFGADRKRVVETWSSLESYRMLIPASASSAERQLFLGNMETLLSLEEVTFPRKGVVNQIPPTSAHKNDHELMTLNEVASWLRLSPRTIRQWAETSELPTNRVGKMWRFRRKDLEEWLRVRAGAVKSRRLRH